MDEWSLIQEFPRYSVNDAGEIQNNETERLIKAQVMPNGHLKVGLMRDGTQWTRMVSRLVLEAFVPNRDPYRSTTAIHLDGDLTECAAYNLAWRPLWFAKTHTRQFRLGNPDSPPIRNLDTGEEYSGVWELVKKYGLLRLDVLEAIGRDWPVYPIMQRFDWL